jgi:hypothetical protein
MRGACVHLDFSGQVRLAESLLKTFLSLGDRILSFAVIATRNCALVFAACRCGLFGVSLTSPPP